MPLALTSTRVTLALVPTTPRSTHPGLEKRIGPQTTFYFLLVGHAFDVRAQRQQFRKKKKDTRAALRRADDAPLPDL